MSFWHDRKIDSVVDNFQLAVNRVLDVIFAMFNMLRLPYCGFLKILLREFLLLPLPSISWRIWLRLVPWFVIGRYSSSMFYV